MMSGDGITEREVWVRGTENKNILKGTSFWLSQGHANGGRHGPARGNLQGEGGEKGEIWAFSRFHGLRLERTPSTTSRTIATLNNSTQPKGEREREKEREVKKGNRRTGLDRRA